MDTEHALAMARYLMSLGMPGGAVSGAAPMLGPQGAPQSGVQQQAPGMGGAMPGAPSLESLMGAQPNMGGYMPPSRGY